MDVTYVSEDTGKGTVNNDKDTIQIVTAEGLTGSTATAKPGYKFEGWYKGETLVTAEATLGASVAKAALNQSEEDGTYEATEFTAKFSIDADQTVEVTYVS